MFFIISFFLVILFNHTHIMGMEATSSELSTSIYGVPIHNLDVGEYIFIPNTKQANPQLYAATTNKKTGIMVAIKTDYDDNSSECLIIHFQKDTNLSIFKSFHTLLNKYKPSLDFTASNNTSCSMIQSELNVFSPTKYIDTKKNPLISKRKINLFEGLKSIYASYYICNRITKHHKAHATKKWSPTAYMLINPGEQNAWMSYEQYGKNPTTIGL